MPIKCNTILTNLDKYGPIRPIWTNLEQSGPISTNMDQSGPIWTNLDQSRPIWTNLDQSGPIWTNWTNLKSHRRVKMPRKWKEGFKVKKITPLLKGKSHTVTIVSLKRGNFFHLKSLFSLAAVCFELRENSGLTLFCLNALPTCPEMVQKIFLRHYFFKKAWANWKYD